MCNEQQIEASFWEIVCYAFRVRMLRNSAGFYGPPFSFLRFLIIFLFGDVCSLILQVLMVAGSC